MQSGRWALQVAFSGYGPFLVRSDPGRMASCLEGIIAGTAALTREGPSIKQMLRFYLNSL